MGDRDWTHIIQYQKILQENPPFPFRHKVMLVDIPLGYLRVVHTLIYPPLRSIPTLLQVRTRPPGPLRASSSRPVSKRSHQRHKTRPKLKAMANLHGRIVNGDGVWMGRAGHRGDVNSTSFITLRGVIEIRRIEVPYALGESFYAYYVENKLRNHIY